MPPPGLGQYLVLVPTEKTAMLLGDVTLVDLALALRCGGKSDRRG